MRGRWTARAATLAMSTMLAGTPGGPFGQTTSVLSAEAAAGRAVPTGAVVVVAATAAAAEAAVVRAGGHVEAPLPLARAVAARIGRSTAARLATAAVKVLPDIRIPVSSVGFGTGNATFDAQISAINPGPGWSLDSGAGVGVALVDTGVADTPDLAGHVVRGPDFSADGQDEGDHQDGRGDGRDEYGHGTFMAGLIAGNGTASASGPVRHVGVAPGATVVSVKVAGRDGSTSLSRLIEGIGWVVVHAPEKNIRVLNLSFGLVTQLPIQVDPLAGAVEAAWAEGITVVASAGNGGTGSVTVPGSDPWVLTAGASDAHGSLAPWSGQARPGGVGKPEVVAPGVSVVSLRAPGSTIDLLHPSARIGDRYFVGSGTSMAAAITSGAAAVLLADHPLATPDDVKGALAGTAHPVPGSNGGRIDLDAADHARAQPTWQQHYPIAFDGLGRGLKEMPWSDARWSDARWSDARWSDARWSDARWSDARWSDARWSDARWSDARWG